MIDDMYSVNYERTYGQDNNSLLNTAGTPHLLSLNYIQAFKQPEWLFYMHAHDNLLEISYVLSGKGGLYCAGKFYDNEVIQSLEIYGGPLGFETVDVPSPNLEYVDHLLEMMLYACCDEVLNAVSVRECVEKKDIIEHIREYLDTNFMENISLQKISEKFHISMYHLARQFKKYTGFTVNNYLVSCRIGEAQRRLIFNSESISKIAEHSGFNNLSYFYSCFRSKVGCTPAEYRLLYGQATQSSIND